MWVLLGFGALSLDMWLITRPWFPSTVLAEIMSAAIAAVATIGGFWMLYTVVRYEKNPWPYIFLTLVPFTPLWYYFERIKPTRRRSKRSQNC